MHEKKANIACLLIANHGAADVVGKATTFAHAGAAGSRKRRHVLRCVFSRMVAIWARQSRARVALGMLGATWCRCRHVARHSALCSALRRSVISDWQDMVS